MADQEFSYRTLQGGSESLVKDKGSKFLGYARSVVSEQEADDFLTEIRSIHPKARHHCYAWRIMSKADSSPSEPVEWSNDDGEPSGTAGRPILGQLIKADVTNAMIIVVRYFGGTLLGTSGLIQAYKACAEAVLENAQIIRIIEKETWQIELDFGIVHLLEEWAPKTGFEILEREHHSVRMVYTMEIEKRKSDAGRKELIAKLLDVYPAEVNMEKLQYETFQLRLYSSN
ncbi:YigZ family protein [Membranicola marinus]|uniref:YigZ family protein n=1 Tax=Membranihabitans marinus TaxID=1227546 RepID=A0A953HZZ0_9BACT|nr:YigZ family protein [Membranihabitans marinus]MBY5959836.1 YigZ family protein [Membranihabitans marinus]